MINPRNVNAQNQLCGFHANIYNQIVDRPEIPCTSRGDTTATKFLQVSQEEAAKIGAKAIKGCNKAVVVGAVAGAPCQGDSCQRAPSTVEEDPKKNKPVPSTGF